MRIDNLVVEKVALGVKTRYLATVGKTRVESENPLLTEWGREEELPEVFRKDFDGFLVGFFLADGGKFVFYAWVNEPFERVVDGFSD